MFKDTNNITLSENVDNLVYDGIGFNGIRYIQESGQKVQGKIYLDKTQPGLWYCLNTNTSINNTSDFTRADSTALLDKLQNLNNWIENKSFNVENFSVTISEHNNFYVVIISRITATPLTARTTYTINFTGFELKFPLNDLDCVPLVGLNGISTQRITIYKNRVDITTGDQVPQPSMRSSTIIPKHPNF